MTAPVLAFRHGPMTGPKPEGNPPFLPCAVMDRRSFLKLTAAAAALPASATLLGACGDGDDAGTSSASPSSAPSASGSGAEGSGADKVKLGFIALTDCAPLVMAKELGIFADRGLDVTLEKQASWPATRDALVNGQIDGAHCLYSMPLSVATSVGGTGSRALKVAMGLSQNGQGITLSNDFAEAGYGDLGAARELLAGRDAPSLAMTFPGGTHDLWLRYWIAATGVDAGGLDIKAVPPPQMVQNMSVGAVSGYCVGEPWNAVAVRQGIGFTHLATQDLWRHHPEKALVVNEGFAAERVDVCKRLMAALLEACRWLDEPANRAEAADTIGAEAYVNAAPDEIRGRLTGEYELGGKLGSKTFEGDQMRFFADGEVNAPSKGYATWFLAQYQRLGLLGDQPDYAALADDLFLTDLYAEVAAAERISVPDDMVPFDVRLDGVTFDPNRPEQEVSRR